MKSIIAFLLFVLYMVSLSLQVPNQLCTLSDSVTVQCASGECVGSTASCPPISPTCANGEAYGCLSGNCTNNPTDCLIGTSCYENIDGNDLTCWNGACVADFSQCPYAPACPHFFVRCEDGSCHLDNCPDPSPFLNCTTDEQQSKSQWCLCKLNGAANCDFFLGCSVGQFQCPDGRCASSFADCAILNKKNKPISACKISEAFLPCYGKDAGGECVQINNGSACPQVAPALTPVYPLTAYVGVDSSEFDIMDYSLQTKIASIQMAPFLSTGNIRIEINNNIPTALLYNSSDNGNLGWPGGRSPLLSIYSPILRISSPELAFATDEAQKKDLKKTFHLHVTFYNIAKPPKASNYQVCLAFLKVPLGFEDGEYIWDCKGRSKDTKQLSAGKGNYTYTATVAMDLLTFNDSNVYIAMVYDGGKFKEAPITIGGGFFAAGFILVVVLTTVVLANRERLVVWGESLVGGGE